MLLTAPSRISVKGNFEGGFIENSGQHRPDLSPFISADYHRDPHSRDFFYRAIHMHLFARRSTLAVALIALISPSASAQQADKVLIPPPERDDFGRQTIQ